MAGDWIAIRTDIHAVPEVLRVARLTGRSVDEVVGLLIRFWAWAQAHTDDGYLAGVGLEDAASGSHVPSRFLGALVEVNWLVCDPEEGLQLPHFDRWMSRGAKRRLKERERMRNVRSQSVRKLFASDANKMRTTEEERRGENTSSFKPHLSENLSLLENEEGGAELFRGEVASGDSPPPSSQPLLGGTFSPNGFERISVLVFECRGKQPTWQVPEDFYEELKTAFEGIDVAAEILKAYSWLKAHPDRKKTARGMRAFLWRWLARTSDCPTSYGRKEDEDIYGVS